MKLCLAVWIALLILATPIVSMSATGNPTAERFAGTRGEVDWDQQVLKAVGRGIPPGDIESKSQAALMAQSAALADAFRNLVMVVDGVRVTGDTFVKNYITESDEVRLRVEGFIRGATVVSREELADGSFEITIQLPLNGRNGLMSGLAPQFLFGTSDEVKAIEGGYTGLIIDARGLGVSPSISPSIYDEDGNELYGTIAVSPDYAIDVGIAAYPKGMDQALKSPRTGSNPLVVKGFRKSPESITDIIVSLDDAAKIRDANRSNGILNQCRVAILIGE